MGALSFSSGTYSTRYLAGALLVFLFVESFAQSQQIHYTRELHYKFRDGNRWEGVKSREWKQVSGTLELASLVCYEEGWRQRNVADVGDSLSILVYVPHQRDITVSVFNLDKLYFMDPYPPIWGKEGKNTFIWPSTIPKVVDLPVNRLDGVAKSRIENKTAYFPVYFSPPDRVSGKIVAELSFIPSRTATFDFALYTKQSDQPIHTWNRVQMDADKSKYLYWPVDLNASNPVDLTLVATEKYSTADNMELTRRHVFNIYLFK